MKDINTHSNLLYDSTSIRNTGSLRPKVGTSRLRDETSQSGDGDEKGEGPHNTVEEGNP